jgi:hypothetical protein
MRKYVPLMDCLYYLLSVLSIQTVLCLSGHPSNLGHSIGMLSSVDMQWIFFDCVQFCVSFYLPPLKQWLTIFWIVLHSFLSPSISRFVCSLLLLKVGLYLGLRTVQDGFSFAEHDLLFLLLAVVEALLEFGHLKHSAWFRFRERDLL